jgi:hypothetical protein
MKIRWLKNWVKKIFKWDSLSPQKRWSLKFRLFDISTLVFNLLPLSLTSLCSFYGSDKWGSHFYTSVYDNIFRPLKHQKINLLEIGVGGYEDPYSGGESIFLWKSYFPFARLFFIDIVDKTHFSQSRVKVVQGSQGDPKVLQSVIDEAGEFDVIIDDGSHINHHQIESFEILFLLLRDGGFYVIEDTQTSYWPSYGGGNVETSGYENSCMRYFLRLADELNYGEYLDDKFSPSEINKKIVEISFHHNMIVVKKGDNDQVSITDTHNISELEQPLKVHPEEGGRVNAS